MGNTQVRQPSLESLYQRYLTDHDSARFIKGVAASYLTGTLERLAEYGQRHTRRAATMALGFLGDYSSNSVMGRRLRDADRGVRILAENGIRELWYRDGSEGQRQALLVILRLNNARQWLPAERQATDLLEAAPRFAEAWHQRAVAGLQRRRFADAVEDCRQTLELNPDHFGAAVGMGQCYLEMNKPLAALDCFRRALRLCPGLEEVRAHVSYIERALGGK